MSRILKRLFFLLIVGGALAAVYYSMYKPLNSVTLTGIVTTEDVMVGPQVGGLIGRLLVKEGDQIHKDQLIAVMTTDELQANREYYSRQIDSVQSQIGENEAGLRYQERQTEDQIQQAQAAYSTAVAQVGQARAGLENA